MEIENIVWKPEMITRQFPWIFEIRNWFPNVQSKPNEPFHQSNITLLTDLHIHPYWMFWHIWRRFSPVDDTQWDIYTSRAECFLLAIPVQNIYNENTKNPKHLVDNLCNLIMFTTNETAIKSVRNNSIELTCQAPVGSLWSASEHIWQPILQHSLAFPKSPNAYFVPKTKLLLKTCCGYYLVFELISDGYWFFRIRNSSNRFDC